MASQDKDRDEVRDKDKQASELLRRSLAVPAGAKGSDIGACPDPEILAAYSERSLDADEAARWNTHFSQCSRCREQLVVLVRARDSAGTTEEKRQRRSNAVWDWRWLAPATAAIIFVIVVQVFRPPHRAGEQPLVASNQQATPPGDAIGKFSPAPAPAANALSVPSAASSHMRSVPNSDSAESKIATPAKASQPSGEDRKELAANSAAGGGEFTGLEQLKKDPAAPKADASSRGGTGHGSGNAVGSGVGSGVGYASGIAAAPPRQTQTVTVDSAVSSVTPTATAPEAPAPRASAQPISPDISNSTNGGAISPAPAAAAKAARSEHLSAAVATDRSFAQTGAVTVQAGDETSARTLVRTPDPKVLWRFSSGRFVERSSDAGTTWRVQWTSPNAHLVAGAAPAADTCWLVGRDAMILVTTDGRKWKTVAPPANTDFVDVAATDASSATVTSADGRKFTTSDSGTHWSPAP